MVSNRNLLFQGSIFRCELLVSGRVPVFSLVFKNAEKSIKCCSTIFSYRVERCDSLGTEFWTRTPFFSGFGTQHQYQYIPETPNNQLKLDVWIWLLISNHFPCKDLVHHPIETTNEKWLLRTPWYVYLFIYFKKATKHLKGSGPPCLPTVWNARTPDDWMSQKVRITG